MSVNKLKLITIAISFFVIALSSKTQCMDENQDPMLGTWYNELGSKMCITNMAENKAISGTYESALFGRV